MGEVSLHHVKFGVAEAAATAASYRDRFSMQPVANRVTPDTSDYVLASAGVVFDIASGNDPALQESHHKHGDSVTDIALSVADADEVIERARAAGAAIVRSPETLEDDNGIVRLGAFAVFGDLRHTVISSDSYNGVFLPGFHQEPQWPADPLFERVDHLTVCIKPGETNRWVDFYGSVLGFSEGQSFGDREESDTALGLAVTIVSDDQRHVQLALTEPTPKQGGSQIDAFMEAHQGSGIQHIALATLDIIMCVTTMRSRGVAFMQTPPSYYKQLASRADCREDLAALQELGILVDREHDGDLLQIFTKSERQPPTSFFEIIERRGATGFGAGNVRALAASVDREAPIKPSVL